MSSSAARPAETDWAHKSNTFEARLAEFLFRPVDISWLVYFRMAFGLIMLWHVGSYLYSGNVEACGDFKEVALRVEGRVYLGPHVALDHLGDANAASSIPSCARGEGPARGATGHLEGDGVRVEVLRNAKVVKQRRNVEQLCVIVETE